jgi:hypothetical protein
VQSALEGAGLADFSDIGPTLELHDELKCLESEAVHLTATVRAALAHARRHAIDVARSLCPPHTTASTGRTPPVDSPIGVALKAAVDDFSTRVHREVIRFSQGAATPASVSGMSTAGSVVPGAVFSGLQAASQCAEVATGRVEELKLTRLDFDAHRRKAAAAQAKVDAARAKGEGAGMTERQARHLEKLQEHLLRRKQKLAEVGEHFDRLEDDLVREMESSKAAVVPMLQQAPHNFLQLQVRAHNSLHICEPLRPQTGHQMRHVMLPQAAASTTFPPPVVAHPLLPPHHTALLLYRRPPSTARSPTWQWSSRRVAGGPRRRPSPTRRSPTFPRAARPTATSTLETCRRATRSTSQTTRMPR